MEIEKFQKKYRIPSTRLQNWDYGMNALYFITICTKERICYFGEIINEQMILNDLGKIVFYEWKQTIRIREDMNIELFEFVVMPNHFHAIISIGENMYNNSNNEHSSRFEPQSKNLSSIIRGFKSSITKQSKLFAPDFSWQPRFYEHIIRNTMEFERIQNYIINNPIKWTDDDLFV